ncbi:MAG TPA: cyclic lactone autoinducer peptide [Bacillota bacterium]|nr:cyclic lactone autoinducer peptide [Bacillota bacterium]
MLKKVLFAVIPTVVAAIAFLANMELSSACTIGLYQPELPEE